MSLFVDTSVWSLALRRDEPSGAPEVKVLRQALDGGDIVVTTGLILQELLQGFAGPRARKDNSSARSMPFSRSFASVMSSCCSPLIICITATLRTHFRHLKRRLSPQVLDYETEYAGFTDCHIDADRRATGLTRARRPA